MPFNRANKCPWSQSSDKPCFFSPSRRARAPAQGGKKHTCGCRPARPMCLWSWGGSGARSGWAGEVAVVAARKKSSGSFFWNWKCASRRELWTVVRSWCVTFWLENALRATAARNFSFPIWPDVSRPAVVTSLFFDPHNPHWCFDFPNILRTRIVFLLSCFFWLDSVSLLCFSSPHIVGSLTSKLPLAKNKYMITIN